LKDGTKAAYELSANYTLFQFVDNDLGRVVRAMRELIVLEDKQRRDEMSVLTKKNPQVANIVGNADTYEFMKIVMVVCEDHYRQGDIYTIKWLKANFQQTHATVSPKLV
jgi:hypothetical protein